MTAIISNIDDYRKAPVTDATFRNWTDNRFRTRMTLLEQIELKGIEALGDMGHSIVKVCFPNGFDPANHPEDNIDLVRAEGVRRGVLTP